jgi:RNA polymerase sigma factor (sigma-70 family)
VSEAEAPLTIAQHLLVSRALDVVDQELDRALRRYGAAVDQDGARSDGSKALLDCARRFEEGRGKSFATFARFRVRGAMLSHVRASTRRAAVKLKMLRALAHRMAEYHDDFDVVEHDKDECQRRLDAMGAEHALAMALAGAAEATRQADEDAELAEEYVEAIEGLRQVVGPATKEERRLLDLVFASDFNFHQAAEDLGVAKDTAWRRLRRLLAKLRRGLRQYEITRAPPPLDLPAVRPVLLRVVKPGEGGG